MNSFLVTSAHTVTFIVFYHFGMVLRTIIESSLM